MNPRTLILLTSAAASIGTVLVLHAINGGLSLVNLQASHPAACSSYYGGGDIPRPIPVQPHSTIV